MKRSGVFTAMLALMLFATAGWATTNDHTPLTGNYAGSLETKSFLVSRDAAKSRSFTDYNVEFVFNGNVFIYKTATAKCMGNYTLEGDKVIFTVKDTKGDAAELAKIFSVPFKYSMSDETLMLIGNADENGDVRVLQLNRQEL